MIVLIIAPEEEEDEKFGLIGFSMGGKIALQTILLFPDRIHR